MPKVLVIGYGNLLRGDDAVGCHVAHLLEEHFHGDPKVEVIAAQQLLPEMADDVSKSEFVLFLDASCQDAPGTIRQSKLLPEPGPAGFSHELTPSSLLAAVGQLYGDAPEALSITLAGWSFELDCKMSPSAMARTPEMLRQAVNVIAQWERNLRADEPLPVKSRGVMK